MTTELREQLLKSLRRQSKGELIEMIGRGLEVQDELWTARAALAESEKRAEAMRTGILNLTPAYRSAYVKGTSSIPWSMLGYAVRDLIELAGRAPTLATPPRSGPLTNRDVGDESDARAKGRQ